MLGSLHIFRNYSVCIAIGSCSYASTLMIVLEQWTLFCVSSFVTTFSWLRCVVYGFLPLFLPFRILRTVLSVFGEYSCILILFIMSVHRHIVKDGMTTYKWHVCCKTQYIVDFWETGTNWGYMDAFLGILLPCCKTVLIYSIRAKNHIVLDNSIRSDW